MGHTASTGARRGRLDENLPIQIGGAGIAALAAWFKQDQSQPVDDVPASLAQFRCRSKPIGSSLNRFGTVAKIYFNYSAMNAGKSTVLLQASHNYRERGMSTMLLTAALDDRSGVGKIGSRIGLEADAHTFSKGDNLYDHIAQQHEQRMISCVLVDEAQFLSADQVWQLCRVADRLGIPVMCYGLRTDFQGKLFPGSSELLALADSLREIRTICWCGRKATMVVRLDEKGRVLEEGDQVAIGGEESYVSLCRRHWDDRDIGPANQLKMFL